VFCQGESVPVHVVLLLAARFMQPAKLDWSRICSYNNKADVRSVDTALRGCGLAQRL